MCNIIPCPKITILSIKSVIPENEILSTVIEAIAQKGDCRCLQSLLKSLNHSDFDVRSRAAIALGKIRCDDNDATLALREAISQLIDKLEDTDSYIRYEAARYLGKIPSETALSELSKKLKNPDFIVANQGENFTQTIEALEAVQQSLKYYKPAPSRNMNPSNNYALLIGVGECEESKLSLPVTVQDVQALKTLLTDKNLCGYINNDQHLRLLHDATATSKNILDGLTWLKQQAEKDPEATVFIFYSGHGFLDESGDYYLIPHETDRLDIPNTALTATKFNAALQQIPAKRLLVIIDSCHAQGMASSKEGANNRLTLPKGFTQTALPNKIIDELKKGTGKVVFTSSRENQLSWVRPDGQMSVYTYHLLEALQGVANRSGDKVVRVSHLMNYLGKKVPESAQNLCQAEQTPFFDFATEDFPIALLRGNINPPSPISRRELDSATIQEVMEILEPFMQTLNERRAFLLSALSNQRLMRYMDFSGAVADFIPRLINKLESSGRLESGEQPLWKLLEYTHSQVGVDIQQRIDNLETKINI